MDQTGFWWILLAGAVYGVLHSAAASLTLKALAVRLFGEAGRKYYRFGFVVFALITTLAYIALVSLLPDARLYVITAPWIYLTVMLQAGALVCLLLSLRGTGLMAFLGVDSLLKPSAAAVRLPLVTKGFYRYTRHPIYFFTYILIWLIPQMTWNLLAFNLGVTLYMMIGSVFEERKLISEFGEDYIAYRAGTPWIFPIKLK